MMIDSFFFSFSVTVQLLLEEMRSLREELAEVATLASTPSTWKPFDDKSVRNTSMDSMMMMRSPDLFVDATLWWLCVVASCVCVWTSLSSSWRTYLIMDAMAMPKLQVSQCSLMIIIA